MDVATLRPILIGIGFGSGVQIANCASCSVALRFARDGGQHVGRRCCPRADRRDRGESVWPPWLLTLLVSRCDWCRAATGVAPRAVRNLIAYELVDNRRNEVFLSELFKAVNGAALPLAGMSGILKD